jgi:hypothetical protein
MTRADLYRNLLIGACAAAAISMAPSAVAAAADACPAPAPNHVPDPPPPPLNLGTIKKLLSFLEEIDNAHLIPAHGPNEPGFIASAFRPIVENKKRVSFTMGADPDSESWDNRKHAKEKV